MSEYIRNKKNDTNECPNEYLWQIHSNIRIHSSHSGLKFGRKSKNKWRSSCRVESSYRSHQTKTTLYLSSSGTTMFPMGNYVFLHVCLFVIFRFYGAVRGKVGKLFRQLIAYCISTLNTMLWIPSFTQSFTHENICKKLLEKVLHNIWHAWKSSLIYGYLAKV